MKNIRIILNILFLCVSILGWAQSARPFVKKGNELYLKKEYKTAETFYRSALKKDSASTDATYNLGNTLYKQGKYDESASAFDRLIKQEKDSMARAQAYHNMGNAYMQNKKYQESVSAYKNALKINPNDEDTRYNLAYALEKLKQEQNKNKDKKKDKDKKDDKKDDKNKDKQDKDKNENQDKDKQDKDKQDQQKEQPKPSQQEMSKEQAQKILDALKNDEKKVQDKLKRKNEKGVPGKIEKDW